MPCISQNTTKSGTDKTQKQKRKKSKRSKHKFAKLPRIPKIPKRTPKKDRQKRIKNKKAKKSPKVASAPVKTPNDRVKAAQSVSKSQPLNAMKTAEHLEEEEVCFHIEKSNNEKPDISTNLDSIIADKNPLTKKTVQIALIKKIHDAETAEGQQAQAQNENIKSMEGEEASIDEVQQIEHQLKDWEDHALRNRQKHVMEQSRYVLSSMSPKERPLMQEQTL